MITPQLLHNLRDTQKDKSRDSCPTAVRLSAPQPDSLSNVTGCNSLLQGFHFCLEGPAHQNLFP